MKPATLNGLMAATQTELPLPERARQLLSRDTLLVRMIDRGSLFALHPMAPEEVLDAPPELAKATDAEKNRHFQHRLREWLRVAPAEERVAYRLETERVKFRAIALAALAPRMTVEEAERLGDDAEALYVGILEFSGLGEKSLESKADANVGA